MVRFGRWLFELSVFSKAVTFRSWGVQAVEDEAGVPEFPPNTSFSRRDSGSWYVVSGLLNREGS